MTDAELDLPIAFIKRTHTSVFQRFISSHMATGDVVFKYIAQRCPLEQASKNRLKTGTALDFAKQLGIWREASGISSWTDATWNDVLSMVSTSGGVLFKRLFKRRFKPNTCGGLFIAVPADVTGSLDDVVAQVICLAARLDLSVAEFRNRHTTPISLTDESISVVLKTVCDLLAQTLPIGLLRPEDSLFDEDDFDDIIKRLQADPWFASRLPEDWADRIKEPVSDAQDSLSRCWSLAYVLRSIDCLLSGASG